VSSSRPLAVFAFSVLLAVVVGPVTAAQEARERAVSARVQPRPGAPAELMEMKVREVPVNPESIAASEAELTDGELVLGVVVDGLPMAYPIRYLAAVEVVNDVVGDTSLAPTW